MGRSSTSRARLVDCARELIHASNYGSASVDDLCAGAGVKKGSFYYFFPSKRDLALTVLDAQWAGARQNVLKPAFKPDLPPLERITRFFRRAAHIQRRPVVFGCPFGNLALELGTLDDAVRDKVSEIFEGYRGYFDRALREAVSAGDIAPLDVPRATQALLAYFQGAMLLAKTANDADVIEQLGERAVWLVGGVATSTPEAISERTTING
jgi:TetR/AcrR family transcriptional regulator, transcriptional repressor for nem operon